LISSEIQNTVYKNSIEEVHIMPRRDDIETAFRQAIFMEPSGRRTVTTADFVKVLLTFNWDWTPREANQWIEGHVSTFKDISQQEGELRTFMMYNPNGGL